MIINLLDIAPMTDAQIRALMERRQREQEAAEQAAQKANQQTQLSEKELKKAEKAAKKQAKKLEKQAKKLEKQGKKLEKKMEKQGKKLEKQFSATVQEGTENYGEVQEASMPMGVIICLCASLVICLASAWFYRRSLEKCKNEKM